jgi:phage terminase large subunit GpA-like protein
MRRLCDIISKPGIEEIVGLKGAQISWSELCRNILGYWIDADPGPTLILMPDENATDSFREERLSPLFKNSSIARHMSGRAWDEKKHSIKFDTMHLFLTWAGSKSGTKSRPIRYLICEEPDEYPPFSSTGGDPLAKAMKRLTTYADKGRARVLVGGTPTTRMGNVWKRWEMCAVRYHYWVPCPHCKGYQRLLWKQVKWPKLDEEKNRAKRAEKIRSEGLAYYECEHCKQSVKDHHKPRMLRLGKWASEDQVVTLDGRVVGPDRVAKRIGFHIPSTYSPWVSFSQLAAEWMEAQGDPQALCDFINQRLAEPFEEQRSKLEPTIFEVKAKGSPPPMLVPSWARLLVATADTQGNDDRDGYFWYTIRAWGLGYRSQLIDFGVCHSKSELTKRCLETPIPHQDGQLVTPAMLLVDIGGPRWSEVYQMAQADARIKPAKGDAKRRTWMIDERLQKKHNVVLWLSDTFQSKDLLNLLINDPDATRWLPHSGINADYCSQMCSEQKVFNPTERCEEWIEIVKNNNHLFDCEQMQVAVAWRMGMGAPEPPSEKETENRPATPNQQQSDWVNAYRGKY